MAEQWLFHNEIAGRLIYIRSMNIRFFQQLPFKFSTIAQCKFEFTNFQPMSPEICFANLLAKLNLLNIEYSSKILNQNQ